MTQSRKYLIGHVFLLLNILLLFSCGNSINNPKPNFILIFCDDMGYGDPACYGSEVNKTPEIDRMASEGMLFTDFYVTSGVCTPSRSSLMTGCYPLRVGMDENYKGYWVLFPGDKKGLNPEEVTVAEILRKEDYKTACIGKWHLGDQPEFMPLNQGFDYYFGIPYSNDMGYSGEEGNPPLPLIRNETVIEAPVDQDQVTKRYTEEVISFIQRNRDNNFFIYLAHTMVHYPLHSSEMFSGKSENGKYGDAVAEIDWSTGQILQTLRDLGIDNNTLVIFTSDNGATRSGSNAPFSGGKAGIMEGSMREPFIAWWPGTVPASSTCHELVCSMDILPTFSALAGGEVPDDRVIDGKDISPLLLSEKGAVSPHEVFYYYFMSQLQAVRAGDWKLHLPLENKQYGWLRKTEKSETRLYNLKDDPAETNNLADRYPEIVEKLSDYAEKAREDIGDYERPGKNARPAGWIQEPVVWTLSDF